MNTRKFFIYIVVDNLKDIKYIKAAKNKNEFIKLQSKSYDIQYRYLDTNSFSKVIDKQQKTFTRTPKIMWPINSINLS
jgi:hypothetical protein